MKSSNTPKCWVGFALPTALGLGLTFSALAQTNALPIEPSDAGTDKSSYAARVLNPRGVHEVDPNVYVYNAEFAKRFQMPQEWVSDELKGVDAVAFRVVPSYKTCGWGGNPQACREDEVRCEMDLYFDHQRNPLPWDERRPERYSSARNLSANFLWAGPNSNLRYQQLIKPPRPGDLLFTQSSPFVDSKTGRGLGWQAGFSNSQRSGSSYMGLVTYDKELFLGTSLIVIAGGCAGEFLPEAIWLDATQISFRERTSAYKLIDLPQKWGARVKQLLALNDQRSKAFFKEQGEKALKTLKEAPVPDKAIVPLQ